MDAKISRDKQVQKKGRWWIVVSIDRLYIKLPISRISSKYLQPPSCERISLHRI